VQARWMRFTSEMTFSMGFIAAAPGGERGVRWKVLEGREGEGCALCFAAAREPWGVRSVDEGSRETSLSWNCIGYLWTYRFYPWDIQSRREIVQESKPPGRVKLQIWLYFELWFKSFKRLSLDYF
jgi:hypothetical protein